jgi:hypothetical protein
MDCDTARLLLELARTHASDLGAAEADELQQHLGRCPGCSARDSAGRRLDERLGGAMRQVEVPEGLRDRVLARLEAERGRWYRQRLGHGMRALAAVAALLVLAWAWWHWFPPRPPTVDVEEFLQQAEADALQPSRDRVQESLRRIGADAPLPENFNYAFLTAYGVTELPGQPGRKVALLEFTHPRLHVQALVYVLPDREFNLDGLTPRAVTGSRYKLQVIFPEAQPCALLVLHTGEDLSWLLVSEPAAA